MHTHIPTHTHTYTHTHTDIKHYMHDSKTKETKADKHYVG